MAYSFNQKRVPEFLIKYRPEHSSESLLIPDSFVSLFNRPMPKNAVLSNHVGSLWHVIVDCIDGKVFFLNDWKEFVKDNSIESGDSLIFRYNGQCEFGVKVFGQDACEKTENKANGTSYMNEEEKQKEEEAKENDKEEEDCDDHLNDNDSDYNDSDYEDYIDEQEEDSTKEKESIKISKAGKQSVGNIGGSRRRAAVRVEPGFKRTNPIHIGEEEEEEEESTTGRRRPRRQSCGNNGLSDKRTNGDSSFIANWKPGSNFLYVPRKVVKLNKNIFSNPISFHNKDGMHWPGDVISRSGGITYIRGWKNFCMANRVSMDHWWVCEFIQGNNQEKNIIDVKVLSNRN